MKPVSLLFWGQSCDLGPPSSLLPPLFSTPTRPGLESQQAFVSSQQSVQQSSRQPTPDCITAGWADFTVLSKVKLLNISSPNELREFNIPSRVGQIDKEREGGAGDCWHLEIVPEIPTVLPPSPPHTFETPQSNSAGFEINVWMWSWMVRVGNFILE